jgi:hypothetical protein
MNVFRHRLPRCLVVVALLGAAITANAAPRFYEGLTIGSDAGEVKLADALQRSDGGWVTYGSHVSMIDNSEVAYLSLRDRTGLHLRTIELVPDGGLSHRPQSMIELPDGDLLVSAVEYDPMDFSAYRGALLWRIDAGLDVVWSARVRLPQGSVESARLRALACAGCAPDDTRILLFGHVQREVGGSLDAGDGFIANVDASSGALTDVATIGTATSAERVADVRKGAGRTHLLLEISAQPSPMELTSGDGLVSLADDTGGIVDHAYVEHPTQGGVRARAMSLLPLGDDWVIAGRRTAFGPNFFYLHRVSDALVPDAARVLVPFFNASDVEANADGIWLYGEVNGENLDTGTVLMNFDASLAMTMQRRYVTDTAPFPTGALAFGTGGALLALGANRAGEEVLVYESVHRVSLPDGEGVLCNEEDYAGFTAVSDPATEVPGWLPEREALAFTHAPVQSTTRTPERATVPMCAGNDDLVFADGFEVIEKHEAAGCEPGDPT